MGTEHERSIGEQIIAMLETRQNVINLMGKTDLPVMLEIIKISRALITNDSGPMHLAAALNVPTISFFGPTDPDKTGPYGPIHKVFRTKVSCAPCFLRQCPLPKQLCRDDAFNPTLVSDYLLSEL